MKLRLPIVNHWTEDFQRTLNGELEKALERLNEYALVPYGGTDGQVLTKDGDRPFVMKWAPVSSGGGLSDGDKGDITVSFSGSTWTIDNSAVTYAKIQNVSASPRVIGRKSVGAGPMEECTISEVLDFLGSVAQGNLIYRGASTWSLLPPGTAGQILQTNGAGANPSWVTNTGISTGTDIQFFTSSGTWTKPAGAKACTIIVIAGGGGGGSGAVGTAQPMSGGAGGGSGGISIMDVSASILGSTESVVVGAGGAGGTAISATTANNDGNNGNNGGDSSFGIILRATGGTGGGRGRASTTSQGAGSAGTGFTSNGGAGGLISTGGTTTTPTYGNYGGGGGGGGGSGNSTGNGVFNAGASSGKPFWFVSAPSGGAAGNSYLGASGGSTATAGGNGWSMGDASLGGGGGGGGACIFSPQAGGALGQAGGAGGNYGGGGGGGGAAAAFGSTPSVSGAGGNGAGGCVLVITHL